MKWPTVKIGDVSEILSGNAWKSSGFTTDKGRLLPVIRIQNVSSQETEFVYWDGDVLDKYRIENGDLLLSLSGNVKLCQWKFGSALLNQRVVRLTPLKMLDKRYFYWALDRVVLQLEALARHAVIANVSVADLKSFEIPLPPLAEQKRIATILDKADAIRRKRQQAIQLADDFLRAVFLDMFGDPVTNPKGWAVRPVGDLCDCIVPGRDKPKSFNGSTPWITTNELIHLGVTFKKKNYIGLTVGEISEVRARVVPKESVIMTCVGDLGVVSVAGEDMVINQQLHAFLPSEEIAPSYLSFSLASQKGYMLKMASSTTLPYMNKTVCNSVPVMLPPKAMQNKFESLVAKVAAFKLKSTGFSDETAFQAISQKAFSGQL